MSEPAAGGGLAPRPPHAGGDPEQRPLRVPLGRGALAALLLGGLLAAFLVDGRRNAPARQPLGWPGRADPAVERGMRDGLERLRTRRDPDGAARRFREVLGVRPEHVGAAVGLAAALDAAGRADEARAAWLDLLTRAAAAHDAARVERALRRLRPAASGTAASGTAGTGTAEAAGASTADGADGSDGTSSADRPDSADRLAELMRAGLAIAPGAPAEAARVFRAVLDASPRHYGASYQLALALERAGRPAEARAAWEEVRRLAAASGDAAAVADAERRLAADPAAAAQALEERMRAGLAALYETRDYARAIALFREVLAEAPAHYGATFQLALALERSGGREAARAVWCRVREMARASGDGETERAARERCPAAP